MSKLRGIFIDYRNEEQVKWWNNIASKLVRVVHYDTIVETATNKPIGVVFAVDGFLANWLMEKNSKKFIKDPVKTTLSFKK